MKKSVLYMRRSTDKQENSIDAQRRVLHSYAVKNKYQITSEYVDEGISGRTAEKRLAFMQMIDDSSKKMFDVVLVYDSSRFARNLEESIVYKSILKRNGVELISATEPTVDEDSSLITDAMLGALNEMFSRKLSKSVKRGMIYNVQNGKFQVPPPYGYRMKDGNIFIIKEEADTIRMIFNIFINKSSWYSTAVNANEKGLRKRSGALWSSRDIKRLLTNKTYIGFINYDGEVYKGNHERIVDEDLFNNVQRIIDAKPSRPKSRPENTYKHWLSGLLKCSNCNSSMSCITPKKGSSFFRCHAHSCGKCKESNFILVKDIEVIILRLINSTLCNTSLENYDFSTSHNNDKNEKIVLISRLKKIYQKLERYKNAYSAGIDTLEEYKRNKEKCLTEELNIKHALNNYSDGFLKKGNVTEQKTKGYALIDMLTNPDIEIEKKSLAIKNIICKITYNKKNSECIIYYYL